MGISEDMIVYHHIPKKRLKMKYLIKRSYLEGYDMNLRWKGNVKMFIMYFFAMLIDPIRFLFSWDINRFFRLIMHVSYVMFYLNSRIRGILFT